MVDASGGLGGWGLSAIRWNGPTPRPKTHKTNSFSLYEIKKKKTQGTVKQLQDLTGWSGHQVLYFGDHPYSDLADVTLEHGWRTGAIIHELTVGGLLCSFFLNHLKPNQIFLAWNKHIK